MKFKSNLFLTITIIVAFALTSCGSSKNNSIIATAVALTVQAQNTQPASVTDTPSAALATASPSREYVQLKRSYHKHSFRQYSRRGASHSHTFCNLLSRIHWCHQILYSERHVHQ